MPLVFVHGVNVRQGEIYEKEVAFRNRHFVEVFYKQLGRNVSVESIFNPYWGDLGAKMSADTPFLPNGGYEMLWRKQAQSKDESVEPAEKLGFDPACDKPLLKLARQASLDDVIDLLWGIADQEMHESGSGSHESAEELARLAQIALDFSHSPEGELWLRSIDSDEELLARLGTLLRNKGEHSSKADAKTSMTGSLMSAGNRFLQRLQTARKDVASGSKSLRSRVAEDVADARLRIRQKAVGTTARLFNEPLRAIFHQQCALLIGDSFAYFSTRGNDQSPAPIAQRVIDSLRQAVALKEKEGGELIVVGHSMGGVILCDIITCYGKDIPIDMLITVGSQFPLFTDLEMFPGINGAERPIRKPDNVKHWINIFDPHDFLGYPAARIFQGVQDFHLPTYALGGSAHTNYFARRSFYFQLARRLLEYLSPTGRRAGAIAELP